MSQSKIHPVDQVLPPRELFTFGLQHVLVMYAGAVAVPLILGSALGLSQAQVVTLINANLLTSGIATLLQTLGLWRFGARLPLIQGCSFIALAPMIMIGKAFGLAHVFGAVIAAGALTIAIAPLFSRLLRFFPPVVIGSLITVIGISLMPAAAIWLGGGQPGAADFGKPANLLLGVATVAITLVIHARFRGFIGNLSVLLGLIAGSLVAAACGMTDFSQVSAAAWFELSAPMAFGVPQFSFTPVLIMLLAMLVIMAETTGNCLAIGKLTGRPTDQRTLANAFRADGLSTMLGGMFNSFPYNAFTQNTGLIALSGVKSRYVVAAAGAIMVLMGLFPKLGALIASVPTPVLGGCAIVMFGMTTVAGIQELARVRFEGTRNGLVVAVSVSIGVLPMSMPALFGHVSGPLKLVLESGIFLAAVSAILLNLLLNRAPDTSTRNAADSGLAN
ncbi:MULTISPECIES: nucleobase:cation symporter-2 family protein [Pseudomonas]|uniref:nucleobase:cation symporter-2 family protein n=1 Tax=Pseudomonas TaxID=286 RepID=UPI000627E045|nr:nucleobase:cation symporter-2 family protein [Pseudomonas putida]MRF43908.1 purine permease [Escherichia coli]KKO17109.1 permease [Pseudomonas putida KG-4]MDZ5111780.1 nucleobase:cation symporter-2 family protein [Pseudomonas putida]GLO38768.1 xanthine permease [Pseudomonas putida]HDS0978182.1 purine permease [Pseudomonas putida]